MARRITKHLFDLRGWPELRWDWDKLADALSAVRYRQGRLVGCMAALAPDLQQAAVLRTLTEDVIKTSEIEGDKLDAGQVRSAVARRLGMDLGELRPADQNVEGVVAMTLEAVGNYDKPLTTERLITWHAVLSPAGRSGMSERREAEMAAFLDWMNDEGNVNPVLKAALAELWFISIHPFDEGNGRIARAIADMQLARSEESPQRSYSMSAQIMKEREAYFEILKRTQGGTLDVRAWLEWFLGCLERAIDGARETLASVFSRAEFWEDLRDVTLNARQRMILQLLLEGFEGKLTTTRYAKLGKCSQDSAYRDVVELEKAGVLVKSAERGRSTSYGLAWLFRV